MRKGLGLIVWMWIFAGGAFAQTGAGQGSISGFVQDLSKAAVPGAAVVVANDSKGIRRTIETNGQGVFTAPAFIPAEGYSVTVTKSGLAMYQSTGVTLAEQQE
jgi:hypothetical protein